MGENQNRRPSWLWLTLLTASGALALYARTAAPDVLSGDSGEFQFAAPLLAIPHPTGYPLYIILGKLATALLPIGSIAYRVTLVSVITGAGTVALLALLTLRATGRILAALTAAAALTVAPGMWNAATIAEVYTLNTLLLLSLLWLLWQAMDAKDQHDTPQRAQRWFAAAAFVAGLGVSHHGSFIFIGVPLLLIYGAAWFRGKETEGREQGTKPPLPLLRIAGWGILGLLPWVFILAQYARWGPFNGLDHGLHRAAPLDTTTYFWGAPTSWGETLDHLAGGVMRGGIFQRTDLQTIPQAGHLLWERIWFEFGPIGGVLGTVGGIALLRRTPWMWAGSAWIATATVFYFASLGGAVQDALVFTLPLVLVWALWVGIGAETVSQAGRVEHKWRGVLALDYRPLLLIALLIATLVWGHSRFPYGNKHHLWLFRTFGEGTLAHMEPDSVVMVRWEQGTILQYLRLVEGQRPDIWVDIVEPGDEPWRERAQRRYASEIVYIIGSEADKAETGAQKVWGTDYATLFRLNPRASPLPITGIMETTERKEHRPDDNILSCHNP